MKAFLLLIITPHVVLTAECRHSSLPEWPGAHPDDWLKFISPKIPSAGMFSNRWLLNYPCPLPCPVCFCAPPVVSGICFCCSAGVRMFSQMMFCIICCDWHPDSSRLQLCRYSRWCFLIVRIGMICWSMPTTFVLDLKQAVWLINTSSLYHGQEYLHSFESNYLRVPIYRGGKRSVFVSR